MIIKNLKIFLLFIIVSISGFLFIINIEHSVYLNKKYSYNFDTGHYVKKIRNNLDKLEYNLLQVKLNNTNLSDNDFNLIVGNLTDFYKKQKNNKYINYTGTKKFTQKQLLEMVLNLEIEKYMDSAQSYRILYNNKSEYQTLITPEDYVSKVYGILLSNDVSYKPLYNNYKYNISRDYYEDLKIENIFSNLSRRVDNMVELSQILVDQATKHVNPAN